LEFVSVGQCSLSSDSGSSSFGINIRALSNAVSASIFRDDANKLGLFSLKKMISQLIHMLTENLQLTETDMTIFFRKLSEIKKQQTIEDAFELIKESFYKIGRLLTKQKMLGCTGLPNI
jgi:uncharacterized protein YdiU (UPF0061 family)